MIKGKSCGFADEALVACGYDVLSSLTNDSLSISGEE